MLARLTSIDGTVSIVRLTPINDNLSIESLVQSSSYHQTLEWVALWTRTLFYDPLTFFATVGYHAFDAVTNLPPLVTMFVFPVLICYLIYRLARAALEDYQAYLDLGRGGTPSTPIGLIKVHIKKFFARVDVLEPPHVPPMLEPYRGQLFNLPKRGRPRPIIKGVAPQRQFDQKTEPSSFDRLMSMLQDAAEEDLENLVVGMSFLEGHTLALKTPFNCKSPPWLWGTDAEWDFEIAHPHRNDGSLHMILHPEDVRTVIESGWGEKHPLATDAWWWKIFYHYIRYKRRPVPYNLCFVYAPKTEKDYEVVGEILKAAVWFNKKRYLKFLKDEKKREW